MKGYTTFSLLRRSLYLDAFGDISSHLKSTVTVHFFRAFICTKLPKYYSLPKIYIVLETIGAIFFLFIPRMNFYCYQKVSNAVAYLFSEYLNCTPKAFHIHKCLNVREVQINVTQRIPTLILKLFGHHGN